MKECPFYQEDLSDQDQGCRRRQLSRMREASDLRDVVRAYCNGVFTDCPGHNIGKTAETMVKYRNRDIDESPLD